MGSYKKKCAYLSLISLNDNNLVISIHLLVKVNILLV